MIDLSISCRSCKYLDCNDDGEWYCENDFSRIIEPGDYVCEYHSLNKKGETHEQS